MQNGPRLRPPLTPRLRPSPIPRLRPLLRLWPTPNPPTLPNPYTTPYLRSIARLWTCVGKQREPAEVCLRRAPESSFSPPSSAGSPPYHRFQRREGCDRFGKIKRCEKLRDGGIEVEFVDEKEAGKALSATHFSFTVKTETGRQETKVPITVTAHRTKNSSQGVVYCTDLEGVSNDDIADGLAECGVSSARRIMTKREGYLGPDALGGVVLQPGGAPERRHDWLCPSESQTVHSQPDEVLSLPAFRPHPNRLPQPPSLREMRINRAP